MDSLYLLIPLSVVLVLAVGALLAWAVMSGQFDDLETAGWRSLEELDDSAAAAPAPGSSGAPCERTNVDSHRK